MYCARFSGRIPSTQKEGPPPTQSAAPYRVASLSQRFGSIHYPRVRARNTTATSVTTGAVATAAGHGKDVAAPNTTTTTAAAPPEQFHPLLDPTGENTYYSSAAMSIDFDGNVVAFDISPYYSFVASRKKILYDMAVGDLLNALRQIAPPELRKKIVSMEHMTAGNLLSMTQLTREGMQRTKIGNKHGEAAALRATTSNQGGDSPSHGGGQLMVGSSSSTAAGSGGGDVTPSLEALAKSMGTHSICFDMEGMLQNALGGGAGGLNGSGVDSPPTSSSSDLDVRLMALLTDKLNKLLRKVQSRETTHRKTVAAEELAAFLDLLLDVEERERVALLFEEQRVFEELLGAETSDHLATHAQERIDAQNKNLNAVEVALAPRREEMRIEKEAMQRALEVEAEDYAAQMARDCAFLLDTARTQVSQGVENSHKAALESARAAAAKETSAFAEEL